VRQIGREVLRDAIGEIILGRIVGEVREGQHNDGKMPGLNRCGGYRGGERGGLSRRRSRFAMNKYQAAPYYDDQQQDRRPDKAELP